jgi:hypothetical protein
MKIGKSLRFQLVAWSLYWLSLLVINLFYFKGDQYPTQLLVLWTILYTLSGTAIFYPLTKVFGRLIMRKKDSLATVTVAIVLSFFAAYAWGLFEPIISWLINPAIHHLSMKWDINASGVFPKTFIMAFFSVLYIFNKTMEYSLWQKKAPAADAGEMPVLRDTVSVYDKNDIILLPVASIKKISVVGNYSLIVDNRNKKYELKKTLKKWQAELPANSFFKIHRSTLVNKAYIEKIEPWKNYTFRIKLAGLAEPEEVSRRYAALLKKQMNL